MGFDWVDEFNNREISKFSEENKELNESLDFNKERFDELSKKNKDLLELCKIKDNIHRVQRRKIERLSEFIWDAYYKVDECKSKIWEMVNESSD